MSKPKKRTTKTVAPVTVADPIISLPSTDQNKVAELNANTQLEATTLTAPNAKETVYIQFQEKEISAEDIVCKVRNAYKDAGYNENDITSLNAYIKPEESKVYYVVNETYTGSLDF